jgi:hypothetical protein
VYSAELLVRNFEMPAKVKQRNYSTPRPDVDDGNSRDTGEADNVALKCYIMEDVGSPSQPLKLGWLDHDDLMRYKETTGLKPRLLRWPSCIHAHLFCGKGYLFCAKCAKCRFLQSRTKSGFE